MTPQNRVLDCTAVGARGCHRERPLQRAGVWEQEEM